VVKSVVKPLKMGFLRERIVPKKSVFIRVFGVFCFGTPWGRCLAPKARALPTALHPDKFILLRSCPLRFLLQLRLCRRVQCALDLAKLLPLLFPRFFRHRRRSETSPTALHPDKGDNGAVCFAGTLHLFYYIGFPLVCQGFSSKSSCRFSLLKKKTPNRLKFETAWCFLILGSHFSVFFFILLRVPSTQFRRKGHTVF
jgi:hypothetical protein